jgi:hypothetical protein
MHDHRIIEGQCKSDKAAELLGDLGDSPIPPQIDP